MEYRELTVRVMGGLSNRDYAWLAQDIGGRLIARGLGERAMILPDGGITGQEMERLCGVRATAQRQAQHVTLSYGPSG